MAVNNLKKRLKFGCVFTFDTRYPTSEYLEVIFLKKVKGKNHCCLFYHDNMFATNFSMTGGYNRNIGIF